MLRLAKAILGGMTLLVALPGAAVALDGERGAPAITDAKQPGSQAAQGVTTQFSDPTPANPGTADASQPAAARPGPGLLGAVLPGTPPHPNGCLQAGNGYLRARIRGALNLDIDWHNSEIECDGGARPDGSGIRVSFAGPLQSDGRRLRMVFGVGSAQEGRPGRELPTNLTVIFEGEERLFATRGDDHCTVDALEQERVGALGGRLRTYRIVAKGFCISPASTLSGDGRILVNRFDFAGNATFEDDPDTVPPPKS